MGIAGGCGAQRAESRLTLVHIRAAVNHALFRKADLLTALSRSRHFRPSESAVGREIGSPSETCRSQFLRQTTGHDRGDGRKPF